MTYDLENKVNTSKAKYLHDVQILITILLQSNLMGIASVKKIRLTPGVG